MARSSMLTAIQNGLINPLTAVRLPAWSQVQPHIPKSMGTFIWCWSGVLGWIVVDLTMRISHAAVPAA